MAKCIIGENFTFTILFVNSVGSPFTPDSATIEVFYFDSSGVRQELAAAGTAMSSVPAQTGRYRYTLAIPGSLTPADQIYSVMRGAIIAEGISVVAEETVDPFEQGEGVIQVEYDGVAVGSFPILNFIGADVYVADGATKANIYLPPPPAPTFNSHWNTNDGANGNQFVSDGLSRTTTRISTPNGGEGTPFKTGGWAGSNRSTTRSTTVTITTPSTTTGWGGDAYYIVSVFDADGVTLLQTYTSPVIAANFSNTTGSITSSITSYAVDPGSIAVPSRNKAKLSVTVDLSTLISNGGKYNCKVVMHTDTTTDGTGPYTFTQSEVFIDTNPSPASLSGTVSMAENVGIVTKQISGVSYYTIGSVFTVGVTGIDNLNENTIRTSNNLEITPSGWLLSSIATEPFNDGGWTGWTNDNNNTNAAYQKSNWTITSGSQRYILTNASVSARVRDPWSNSSSISSSSTKALIDTYSDNSSDLGEYFNGESRRQDNTYNGGTSSGNWVSASALSSGEALVYFGGIQVPNSIPVANLSTYSPVTNPNYSALGAPVSFYRVFIDSSGLERVPFSFSLAGNFVVNAVTDLANEDLKIFIRRRNSTSGAASVGTSAPPLRVHGSLYDFNEFNDGATVVGSRIRLSSSSGGNINCTFGGALYNCMDGVFFEIEIVNPAIKVTSCVFSFG